MVWEGLILRRYNLFPGTWRRRRREGYTVYVILRGFLRDDDSCTPRTKQASMAMEIYENFKLVAAFGNAIKGSDSTSKVARERGLLFGSNVVS